MSTTQSDTKSVRITLSALTRVEYSEVLTVPANLTAEQLNELVNQRYRDVDGGQYVDDPHYWERGQGCQWEEASAEDQVPSGQVALNAHGALVFTEIA